MPKISILGIFSFFLIAAVCQANVVINEIHYEPENKIERIEYIELYNGTQNPIDLAGMQFSDGITFVFPAGSTLDADSYLILAENKTAFDNHFSGVTAFGQYQGSLSNSGENVRLIDTMGVVVDEVDFKDRFPWPVGAAGQGASMELIHPSLENDLGGSWRTSTLLTPGAQNSVFSNNSPPQARQVGHTPEIPSATDTPIITVKVTDPEGLGSVQLLYQVVTPGSYIPAFLPLDHSTLLATPNADFQPNPAFENPANWITLTMQDNGSGGDAVAGDGIYSVTLPAQSHRTLVRYRIRVTDTPGNTTLLPYPDDPSLNFAYFVYDGIPAYMASDSVRGGTSAYSLSSASTMPVYHLITRGTDLDECHAWDGSLRIPAGNSEARGRENWEGAFVYDGRVYDHVLYRLRQRGDRYNLAEHGFSGGGKRSIKVRFRRGNYFRALDENGDRYSRDWKSLNLQKGNTRNTATTSTRYRNFGLWEGTNSKLWNLAGVPSPRMFPIHFRIIDDSNETSQFGGDFWGSYLASEVYDSRFVDNHDLADGNLYKLKDGVSADATSLKRNQGKNAITTDADYQNIRNNLNPSQSDQWLNENVNYELWYLYNTISQAVRHDDYTINHPHPKNRAWYFEPFPGNPLGYGRLWTLPHDHDASWGPSWSINFDDFSSNAINGSGGKPAFQIQHRNTAREVLDLLWTPETVHHLIYNLANRYESNFADADRDRWKNVPNHSSGAKIAFDNDVSLTAVVNDMTKFAFSGGQLSTLGNLSIPSGGRATHLANLAADSDIPGKPSISYSGTAGFPADGLEFTSSTFTDPQGAGTFAGMEWRVAEVTPAQTIMAQGAQWSYLDNGSNQGTAWRDTTFDDSSWSTGNSPLGYGTVDGLTLATTVSFGGNGSNKHITTYFRTWVNVTDPSQFDYFTFNLLADDGAVVYVNGTEVIRDGFSPNTNVQHQTLSELTGDEDNFDSFTVNTSNFLSGMNLIAIELHQRAPDSSDLGLELSITGKHSTPKYEWNTDWESGELTSLNTIIPVPADVVRAGKTYRARVRYKDSSERWSHWSDPVEFTAGTPSTDVFKDSLVISEIMYHPSDPTPAEIAAGFTEDTEFEYIELRNVGTQTLDLTNIRFTKGIDFDFAGSAITSLAPGGYVLVVENIAAFEMRYGTGLPVAGAWSGKLSNGGEQVKLSFGAGTAIIDFKYDDMPLWPTEPDGAGTSLVLVDPKGTPAHGDGLNWRASVGINGTPGSTDGTTFTGSGDAELLLYATGGLPQSASVLTDGNLTFTFSKNLLAEDLAGHIETSTDLVNWQPAGATMTRTSVAPTSNGFADVTYRTTTPPSATTMFFRYSVQLK